MVEKIVKKNSAIFAGGCFWGVEAYYKRVRGVINTQVGYCGGQKSSPKYEEVCSQSTGHAEAVLVDYDSSQTNLIKLLDHYFHITNPTTLNYQKGDVGTQYRSGIYYFSEEDKQIILEYIDCIKEFYEEKIVTEVLPAGEFWPAEEYHQDYLSQNPDGYCHIGPIHFKKIKTIDDYDNNSKPNFLNDEFENENKKI